ncbi:DNA primase [Myxococcus llanfairpwllgwyngyllgogerychwyrndrobwllllantysiliogogogochensis]|uniref:DNA primase n=1 Tax=Myxococcus llanfairpwllgwyngyllgogerychwyrndrobwllllantysiliogogogochensis TaxID=2590453 RepID=A0A540WU06_9BACT|nr:virulence-associated E family protein [Myxococcus llanfairpwllgwyngyllgogerychwyrndrobwllllantysiliogogogochensis]TQF12491.1 DNA primase [Myxococcus llanfairpwllgwyngyllgogerychwyrndrobwllllantysiliogogogochensis]
MNSTDSYSSTRPDTAPTQRQKVALYGSAQDNVPHSVELSWPELAAKLVTHRRSKCPTTPCVRGCPGKNGPAWSPVDIVERRRSENVRAVTVAVFDLDHLKVPQLSFLDAVERNGLAYALHSTHSNLPPDDYCLRLVMPLSRPVLPREWASVREAAIRMLSLPADPATRDLARMYFLPDAPEGAEPFALTGNGAPLDVDALLDMSRAGLPVSTPVFSAPAPTPDSVPADLYELRAHLRRIRKPEHVVLVRRVLAGEPLAPVGEQDNTLNTLMSCAAFVLPLSTPESAVLELFRGSFAATDWREGAEHLCAQAVLKLRRHRERRKARDEARQADNRAIWEALGGKAPAPTSQDTPGTEEDAPNPDDWMRDLVLDETKDGGKRIRNCDANIYTVLLSSPEWRGVFRFNEVNKALEVEGGPLGPGMDLETLDVLVTNWIQRSAYGQLGLQPRVPAVAQQLLAVAKRNSYDPVADYLAGLVWDGKPRLDELLATYFGARGDAGYLRAVGAKWAISAVARALRPGCKVDTVMILEGPQGLRKSTAFRILGGRYFSDAPVDVTNKDSAMLASQFWFIELAELSTFRKSEDQALKAFITRTEDTYRPPYGRTNVKTPRRCVFVGTTNDDDYLRDPTGHRRFWPVKCSRIDTEALARDRDQIWAEAVVRFHQGESWWLTNEEATGAEQQAALRMENHGDSRKEVVLRWLLEMPAEKRPSDVTILHVGVEAFALHPAQVDPRISREIGAALKALHFTRGQRRMGDGTRPLVYYLPEELRHAPTEKRGERRTGHNSSMRD